MRFAVNVVILAIACDVCLYPGGAYTVTCESPQSTKERVSTQEIERAIKAFLFAVYACDSAEYQKWIVPEPGSNELIGAQRLTAEQLENLRRDLDQIQLRQVSPFMADGTELGSAPAYPVGTKTTFMTGFRGSAIAIPMVYVGTGWKADVRFWLAMKRQAEGEVKQSDPEAVAKAFLYYLLAKQPEKLTRLSASKIIPEEYTAANNLPGGDLDQILSLCIEMPIVRARAGESFRMPSGEIVKAGNSAEALVLVGLLGPVEVAFQVRQVAGEWKVVPQKYFEMLRRAGAI